MFLSNQTQPRKEKQVQVPDRDSESSKSLYFFPNSAKTRQNTKLQKWNTRGSFELCRISEAHGTPGLRWSEA